MYCVSSSRVDFRSMPPFLLILRVVALEDLDCDENSSYEHLGTPTETSELCFENGQLESCHRIVRKRVDGENHYFFTRKYKR